MLPQGPSTLSDGRVPPRSRARGERCSVVCTHPSGRGHVGCVRVSATVVSWLLHPVKTLGIPGVTSTHPQVPVPAPISSIFVINRRTGGLGLNSVSRVWTASLPPLSSVTALSFQSLPALVERDRSGVTRPEVCRSSPLPSVTHTAGSLSGQHGALALVTLPQVWVWMSLNPELETGM